MNFDLILPVGPGKGPVFAELVGELTDDHIAMLTSHSGPIRGATPLRRISDRHKAMARAIAGGTSVSEVAFFFGITPQTLYRLQGDPAFKNLVAYYQRVEEDVLQTTQERLAGVANAALDLIAERLDDDEERKKITIPQAISIAEMGADRTGNGPASTNVQVNINAGLAERMKRAREQAAMAAKDITPKPPEEAAA